MESDNYKKPIDTALHLFNTFKSKFPYQYNKGSDTEKFLIDCVKFVVNQMITEQEIFIFYHERKGNERLQYWKDVLTEVENLE